ncbi:ribonuclease P protein component [Hahella sp. CCB-MM4]|uniref:ribonuclease P protein component n=1 Tax=Hahella sp. (strain CCB-MM4) TaxID=1926491 RepID=UPI000B9C715D|nr:ribonuclease P protein component [Hahella sp. CCB-MM4]OZG73236.1 ribonuclease P protein component [Hahella sp. CCB-MM4]
MSTYEFPRSLRLLKPGDFRNVFEQAEYKAGHPALLLLARSNQCNCPRLGLVIAKRNVKLSTGRNRVKRIIRDRFRLQQHQLPPIDIVVIARRPLADIDNAELHQCMVKLLAKLSRQYESNPPDRSSSSTA